MKELMETTLLKISLENECEVLTFKETGIILDEFADAIKNLIETDSCSENILRTLNYTKMRLHILKSFMGNAEKKSFYM